MALAIWKPVPGFEGLYEVCSDGGVRSVKGRHGRGATLNPKLPTSPREYKAISLHGPNGRVRRSVHSIVAAAFLPAQPSPRHEIRHLDGNRGNNAAENLAWGTRQDNADDRARHGRTAAGDRHGSYSHGLNKSFRKLSSKKAAAARAALKARAPLSGKGEAS